MYLGDFNQNATVRHYFNSVDANGTPAALANGTLAIYKNGTNTSISANATLTASVFGRTGFNLAAIDLSGNTTIYASGNDFVALLTAGDVAGTSITNSFLFEWSINNRAGSLAADATMLSNINTTATSINTTVVAMNSTVNTVNTNSASANTTINAGNVSVSNTTLTNLLNIASTIETNLTLKGAVRLIMASTAGKLSGANTTTVNMTNFAGNVTVISATVDSNGNRTALTYNTTYPG